MMWIVDQSHMGYCSWRP